MNIFIEGGGKTANAGKQPRRPCGRANAAIDSGDKLPSAA